jgi:hypothetical protein
MHLAADAIPLGLRVTGQQVPQLLVQLGDCLVVSSLGLLEHLGSLLNLHLASHSVNRRRDGALRLRGFLEILQRRLPFCNSLGIHATLLLQYFLLDDTEDRNYVCNVFLIVPTGEDRNADVGVVGKLDLQHGWIFLGRDNIYYRYVRNGRPLRLLPLLALGVLQHVSGLEVGTHFDVDVMPESGT